MVSELYEGEVMKIPLYHVAKYDMSERFDLNETVPARVGKLSPILEMTCDIQAKSSSSSEKNALPSSFTKM